MATFLTLFPVRFISSTARRILGSYFQFFCDRSTEAACCSLSFFLDWMVLFLSGIWLFTDQACTIDDHCRYEADLLTGQQTGELVACDMRNSFTTLALCYVLGVYERSKLLQVRCICLVFTHLVV